MGKVRVWLKIHSSSHCFENIVYSWNCPLLNFKFKFMTKKSFCFFFSFLFLLFVFYFTLFCCCCCCFFFFSFIIVYFYRLVFVSSFSLLYCFFPRYVYQQYRIMYLCRQHPKYKYCLQ